MKYYINTLTPIHIGNGEELADLDYFISNQTYYQFKQNVFYDFLKTTTIPVQNFIDWIENNTPTEEKILKYKNEKKIEPSRAKEELKKQFKLNLFCQKNNMLPAFLDYLNKTDNLIKFELGNKKITEKNIRGFLKTGNNQPYIPGTSIKGAIRTALLYHFLSNNANTIEIINILNRNLNDPKIKKETFANDIENFAFYCGYKKNENENSTLKDEKFDVFKFLIVSDGKIKTQNSLTLDNLNLYLVKKDRKGSFVEIQTSTPTVEAIRENTTIEFDIEFNLDYLLSIKNNFDFMNNRIEVKIGRETEFQWIGLQEKIKNIFGNDINEIDESQKEECKLKIINSIIQKVAEFGSKQKEWDKKWLKEITEKNTRNSFKNQNIINGFDKIIGENLIHFGFGTGFTGITDFLYFLEIPELKEKYKEVMDKFEIGDKLNAYKNRKPGEKYNSNPDKFPKSKRLVSRQDLIIPLGWGNLINPEEIEKQEKELKEKEESIKREKELEIERLRNIEIETQKKLEEEKRLQAELLKRKAEQEQAEIEAKRIEKQRQAQNEGLKLENFDASNKNAFENLKKHIEKFVETFYQKKYKILLVEMPEGIVPKEYHQQLVSYIVSIYSNASNNDKFNWKKPLENNANLKKVAEWVGKDKATQIIFS
jgi:CRISPR type III-A-associated RAMP protein Csm5